MTLQVPVNWVVQFFCSHLKMIANSTGARHLDKLLGRYLQYHRVAGSTEATLIHKAKEIGLFLKFLEERGHSMNAKALTTDDVTAHMDDMLNRSLALETRRTRRRALHAWCEWMVGLEIIRTNPVTRVKLGKGRKQPKKFITKAQFQQLLDHCKSQTLTDARRTAILWILATTGMRRRELWLLKVEDLDWDGHRIQVINGKGQKSRLVPFSPLAQEPVKRYLDLRQEHTETRLWITETGSAIGYDGLGTDMDRLRTRAGVKLKDIFHIFRRTFTRDARLSGIPEPYILATTGWSTGAMIAYYTGAMQEEEDNAIDAFNGFQPFVDRKIANPPS